ncbi:Hypothetical predicted protein, partial [Paramuricea clavata]
MDFCTLEDPRKDVSRLRYDWQPATTCRSVSGARHREQSEVGDKPHLARFWRVGRELLMYRTVKLNIFFGRAKVLKNLLSGVINVILNIFAVASCFPKIVNCYDTLLKIRSKEQEPKAKQKVGTQEKEKINSVETCTLRDLDEKIVSKHVQKLLS